MNERKPAGIHLKERIVRIEEIVAVDLVIGLHRNVYHDHANAWELMFCHAGHMVMKYQDDWIDMDAGCCMLIPPGVPHSSVTESEGTRCFFIAFVTENELAEVAGHVIRVSNEQTMLFDALTGELSKGYLNTAHTGHTMTLIPNSELALGAEQLAMDYLEMVLILMLRNKSEKGGLPISKTHVEYVNDFSSNYITDSVTEYIRENVTEKLTVESVAGHFGYSRSRLSTLYKANTGISLNNAIGNEKMLRARHLLIESDLSVTQISELLGYATLQYFTNKFTKNTGMSPSNYARFKRTKVN